jgi:hypothetical protein
MITDDLNAIKQMINLATQNDNTYLSLADLAALDMNENPADTIVNTDGLKASDFTPDASPPTLDTFSINMNTGEILLTFSEPVETDTVVPKGMSFQNAQSIVAGGTMLSRLETGFGRTRTCTPMPARWL